MGFFESTLVPSRNDGVYVEVGANQPSQLSNTYRFYRQGYSGVLVEPDARCCALLRRYRPKDLVINALAGRVSGLGWLFLQTHTVLNSSLPDAAATAVARRLVPSINLDELWRALTTRGRTAPRFCFLLSLDTEGGEEEILLGARELTRRSYFVCLEHHGCAERKEQFQAILGAAFEVFWETGINVLFKQRQEFSRFQEVGADVAT